MGKQTVDEAFEEVKTEFNEFREEFGNVLNAVSQVDQAKPGDDIEALLEALEDTVNKVRTGGLMSSGVNDYSRARASWQEAQVAKK
jgi:hypothetical protein